MFLNCRQVIRERRTLDNTYANDVEAPTLHVSGAEGKVVGQ